MTQPQAKAKAQPRIALFDLDHTLLPIDSDHAWGNFSVQRGWVDASSFVQKNDDFYAQYQAGVLDVHAYVRFATEAIVRQGSAKALAAHADFMREVVQPAIRREALELVQAHRSAGDMLAIVTATNAFVTRPIAQALGVTELIATELARDTTPGGSGWYTGSIAGEPSFRQGKVTRVEQWLQARGWDWETAHTTFYSDSFNDLPLLERVTVPVATNPDARLRVLAQQRGWRILELFT